MFKSSQQLSSANCEIRQVLVHIQDTDHKEIT